jgi:hypothetical protein
MIVRPVFRNMELEKSPPSKPSDVELQKEIELPEKIERHSLISMDRPSRQFQTNASTEMLESPPRKKSVGATATPERRNYEEVKGRGSKIETC